MAILHPVVNAIAERTQRISKALREGRTFPSSSLYSELPSVVFRTGIYLIVNRVNGKVYVGKAEWSFIGRWRTHFRQLERGEAHNQYLQAAWNKHGSAAFTFVVFETCPPSSCLSKERKWIRILKATNDWYGYNVCVSGKDWSGAKHRPETKRKMSLAQIGVKKGIKLSVEHKAKISRGLVGNQFAVGYHHTEETKRHLRKVLLGRKHNMSPEGRAVCAANGRANKGRKHSEVTRAKLSTVHRGQMPWNKGKRWSDEMKSRLSVAHLGQVPWNKGRCKERKKRLPI